MGLFITLAEPTARMKKEAANASVLDTPFGKFARLQIVTIEDPFAGKKPAMPPKDPAALRARSWSLCPRRCDRPRPHSGSRKRERLQGALPIFRFGEMLGVCVREGGVRAPTSTTTW